MLPIQIDVPQLVSDLNLAIHNEEHLQKFRDKLEEVILSYASEYAAGLVEDTVPKLSAAPLTMDQEPARATLEDNEAENSYPPVGTPETAIVVVIDSENFKILAHTGRYFHGTCVCAGYTGEESGLCGVPDEPGFYFFYEGKVWTSQCWETGIVDDWGIEGSFRKATPEDFLTAGLECPLDLREQNKSTDLYTAACAERDKALASAVERADKHGRLKTDYDALRALCEGMAIRLRECTNVLAAQPTTCVKSMVIGDSRKALTAYEKHKAGE